LLLRNKASVTLKAMIVERRRHSDRRRNQRVKSTFAVKSLLGVDVQLTQCEDLGTEGMTLRRPDSLPLLMGLPLTLSFDLPGASDELVVKATVVTDEQDGSFRRTGVHFATISPGLRGTLEAFCQQPTA